MHVYIFIWGFFAARYSVIFDRLKAPYQMLNMGGGGPQKDYSCSDILYFSRNFAYARKNFDHSYWFKSSELWPRKKSSKGVG